MASIDYSKLSGREIEDRAIHSRNDEQAVKKAGYELRMDRVKEAQKNAKSDEEFERYKKVEKQTLEKYNKYHFTNLKS